MGAQIVIDDGTNPPAAGSTDNPSSFVGDLHTLSNFDDTGILGWRWTLVDKPTGSSAVLSATATATTTLTPDVHGRYLVRLETFLDAARTIADDADEQVVGVRYPAPFDWAIPAAGETTQANASRGWADTVNAALSQARQNLMSEPLSAPAVLGAAGTTTLTVGGLLLYDPSSSTGTHTIQAPATPTLGDRWALKNATTSVIGVTISGNGNSLEDPNTNTFLASYVLASALVGLDYIFDGTNWVII